MDMLKKIFPVSFRKDDVAGLVIGILIYLAIGLVAGLIIGLVPSLPVLGLIKWILGTVMEIYCLTGIVLAILHFVKVV